MIELSAILNITGDKSAAACINFVSYTMLLFMTDVNGIIVFDNSDSNFMISNDIILSH